MVPILYRLTPSATDRSIVFPMFMAACMTNDRHQREYLKNRLQMPDSFVGSLPQLCMVLDGVWQTRDAGRKGVEIREIIKDINLALLLV